MKYLRLLLWPFSLLYGVVVLIRNWCYDAGWFKSTSFNLPLITIGNLAVGGAGKSPMTEYLITLIKIDHKVATLSRGYGRETKGFILADVNSTAEQIGDEPAQFKHKFPDVTVAVCEDRITGVERLKELNEIILLDDAFQHRAIKAGLNLCLFDYNKLHGPQLLLPAGDLREPMSGKMRADILIVSKCPHDISPRDKERTAALLRPYPYQHLFHTTISYKPLMAFDKKDSAADIAKGATVFLLTGIAGAEPLKQHYIDMDCAVIHHKYPDHHAFTLKNIAKLVDDFKASAALNKIIITTEKDAERLKQPHFTGLLNRSPVMIQPIGVDFLNGKAVEFDKLIKNYVRKYTTHSSVH